MKVLMQNRDPSWWQGGDMVQLNQTLEALRRLDVTVDFTWLNEPPVEDYDLVHLHNLSFNWTKEQYDNARRQGKPVVISAIYHFLEDMNPVFHVSKYDQRGMIKNSNIICLSDAEANRIKKYLKYPFDHYKVPNGVDDMFYDYPTKPGRGEYLLIAGRIEVFKNQHALIMAAKRLGLPVVVVGQVMDEKYYESLQGLYDKVTFLPPVDHKDMLEIYQGARVICSVSQYELFPLTILEGGLAGCSIVLTKNNYCDEWFDGQLHLCDPEDIDSIESAVRDAWDDYDISKFIHDNFTWEEVGKKVKAIYEEVLR